MTQKDLAEDYTQRVLEKKQEQPMSIHDLCFSVTDIKAAFNAGRNSMVENMPELKWVNVFEDGAYTAAFSFGLSYRIEFSYNNKFKLFCDSIYINCYTTLSATKQEANEYHKKRIKQVLGL